MPFLPNPFLASSQVCNSICKAQYIFYTLESVFVSCFGFLHGEEFYLHIKYNFHLTAKTSSRPRGEQ